MTRFAGMAATVAMCLPVAVLAAGTTHLTPGRWEVSRKIVSGTFNGTALPPDALKSGNETKFVCISAREARDPMSYFTKADTKARCAAPVGQVANGRLKLTGSCGGADRGEVQVQLAGSYGGRQYQMTGTGKMTMMGQPMLFDIVAQGRHVGACKGDETH